MTILLSKYNFLMSELAKLKGPAEDLFSITLSEPSGQQDVIGLPVSEGWQIIKALLENMHELGDERAQEVLDHIRGDTV